MGIKNYNKTGDHKNRKMTGILDSFSAAERSHPRAILTVRVTSTKRAAAFRNSGKRNGFCLCSPAPPSTQYGGSIPINRTNKLISRLKDYLSQGTAMGVNHVLCIRSLT